MTGIRRQISIRPMASVFQWTVLAAFALSPSAADAQIITTIVGTDFQFPNTPIAALNAPLSNPTGITVDKTGNVFFADLSNDRIFEVTSNGALKVVAGNGIFGFSGDGGPAASAALQLITTASDTPGLAVDSAGNLYIADSGNNRIRKVSNGVITTVAGNGNQGFSGDGGPATSASLFAPTGVAVDAAGNLYIADYGNNRIRSVSNGVITTIAGDGSRGYAGAGGPATMEGLNGPDGLAVDLAGNLYIADTGDYRILKVSNGMMTPFAGNGSPGGSGDGVPAASAEFGSPVAVAVDSAGDVYIADEFIGQIRKVSNGVLSTVAGNGMGGFSGDGGPATSASIGYATGVAVDPTGNVYLSDTTNERVRKVSNGLITTIAGNGNYSFSGDGSAATSASVHNPDGIAVDSAGNLYIADTGNRRIRKLSHGVITTVAGNGAIGCSGDGGPAASAQTYPLALTVDSADNLYIAELSCREIRRLSNGVITRIAGGGTSPGNDGIGDGGPATSASLGIPGGVAVDSAGNLYIADPSNARVRKVSNGVITTIAGNGMAGFSGDGGPATSASLNLGNGGGVAVDSAGNLYIADSDNNRIRKVSNGVITSVAGNGNAPFSGDGQPATSASLGNPTGVAVDAAGNLYITDVFNSRIRKVSNGVITTVAGNGGYGFSGDGGPAVSALLAPTAVAVDLAGNVYAASSYFNRIREILVQPPFSGSPLAAGSASLSLSQASGGKPVTASLNADATITESSSIAVPGLAYTASVTSVSSWLSVSPQSGNTPGRITVTADPLNLAPGVYNGTIVISVPLANPSSQTVNVQFTVTAAIPPTLSLDQSHMSFTYATTSTARSQTLIVSNTGGGSLNFTASTTYNSGGAANWLSVSPQAGTATPGNPVALAVTADPSMLSAGTYTGSLTINGGSAGSVTIPITMTITANRLVMLLSQTGLTFTAVQNGGAIPPQAFGVLSLGSGMLNWSVRTSTLPSGGGWLNATPDSGSSDAGAPSPLVTVSVNPASLQPGFYYGLVTVVSPGAANTPQEVVVVLHVLPPGTDVAPIVQPSSLIFTSPAGESSPSSQTVLVYDPTGSSKSFRSGIVASGSGQLVTLPTDATIPPTDPTQIVVQPIVNNLAPGTYPGTLTLQFSDGRVNAVGVTLMVTGSGHVQRQIAGGSPRFRLFRLHADEADSRPHHAWSGLHCTRRIPNGPLGPGDGRLRQTAGIGACHGYLYQRRPTARSHFAE